MLCTPKTNATFLFRKPTKTSFGRRGQSQPPKHGSLLSLPVHNFFLCCCQQSPPANTVSNLSTVYTEAVQYTDCRRSQHNLYLRSMLLTTGAPYRTSKTVPRTVERAPGQAIPLYTTNNQRWTGAGYVRNADTCT